ncbi:MAG: hypothetical protein ACK4YF_06040 [Exilispira sp.]
MKSISVLIVIILTLFSLILIISLYFTFILIASKKYSSKFTIENGIKKIYLPKKKLILLDSKGHGNSSGGFPSYGFFKKYDLYDCYHYVLSLLKSNCDNFNPVIGFLGESMGAAITLRTLSLFSKYDRINFWIVESSFIDLEKLCKIKLV